jgi:phosphatidylserine decarboxylase
VTLY